MSNTSDLQKLPRADCELRHDPASGHWTLVFRKPEGEQPVLRRRHNTLRDFIQRNTRQEFEHTSCVWSQQFCGGRRQEKQALFGLRWANDGRQVEITYDNWHGNDWEVMVVRTDYAQVVPTKDCPLLGEDTFLAEAGAGVHDLIIEDSTEEHEPLGVLGSKRTQLVLMAMLYRLTGTLKGFPSLDESRVGKPIGKESFVRHVALFHNHRREAGGSQEHPHSQCIGIPIIPTDVSAELEHARKRLEQPPRQCVFCEMIEAERALCGREGQKSRILFETRHFLAVVPFAPRHPFEVWILPKLHQSCFGDVKTDPGETSGEHTPLEDLAILVNEVLCRLYVVLDDPAYNLVVHTQPVAPSEGPNKWSFYHWHIRVQPRALVTKAGFERSTEISKLPTTPEEMAETLRRWGALHESKESPGSLAWYIDNARRELAGDQSRRGRSRRLKNIVKVLEPMAQHLVGFVRARALLKEVADEKPHLLLSPRQQQLPDQTRQRSQPEEHAGGDDGPHFRCCPATGRWVLFTTASRRKTVAKLNKERTEKKRQQDEHLERKLREKVEAWSCRPPSGGVPMDEATSASEQAASAIKLLVQQTGPSDDRGPDILSWIDGALDKIFSASPPWLNRTTSSAYKDSATHAAEEAVSDLKEQPQRDGRQKAELAKAASLLLTALRNAVDAAMRDDECDRRLRQVLLEWQRRIGDMPSDKEQRAHWVTGARKKAEDLAQDWPAVNRKWEKMLQCWPWTAEDLPARITHELGDLDTASKKRLAEVALIEQAATELEQCVAADKSNCPFCSPEWRDLNREIVRRSEASSAYVIENSNPLFTDRKVVGRGWPRIGGTGPFRYIDGFGACEVVVVNQGQDPTCQADEHGNPAKVSSLAAALDIIARRIVEMPCLPGSQVESKCIRHITVFSNHGSDAGASTDHSIWQIVGAPIVPTVIERELDHHLAYSRAYSGRCCSCDMLEAEIREHLEYEAERVNGKEGSQRTTVAHKHRSRIVDWSKDANGRGDLESAMFVAFCPYASGSPLELWIVPREHSGIFGGSWKSDEQRKECASALATLLHSVLGKLKNAADDPAYTLVIQQAPVKLGSGNDESSFHWRIVIEPQKLNIPAGFESLTGIWSNIVLPEDAADCLWDTKVEERVTEHGSVCSSEDRERKLVGE